MLACSKEVLMTAIPLLFSNIFSYLAVLINAHTIGSQNPENVYLLSLLMPLTCLMIAMIEGFRNTIMVTMTKFHNAPIKYTRYQSKILAFFCFTIIAFIFTISSSCIIKLFHIPVESQFDFIAISSKLIFSGFFMCMASIDLTVLNSQKQFKAALLLNIISFVLITTATYYLFHYGKMGLYSLIYANLIASIFVIICANFQIKETLNTTKLSQNMLLLWRQNGLPVFSSYCLLFTSQFVIVSILSDFEPAVLAGYSIITRLQTLWMMPAIAIGLATAFIINRSEAGKPKIITIGLVLILITYLLFYLSLNIFSSSSIYFLSSTPEIANIAMEYLKSISFSYMGLAIALYLFVHLDSTGSAKQSLFIQASLLIAELFLALIIINKTHDYQVLFIIINIFNWIMGLAALIYITIKTT